LAVILQDLSAGNAQFLPIGLKAIEICEWAVLWFDGLAISSDVRPARSPLFPGSHVLCGDIVPLRKCSRGEAGEQHSQQSAVDKHKSPFQVVKTGRFSAAGQTSLSWASS
jgi:hypothetical protein